MLSITKRIAIILISVLIIFTSAHATTMTIQVRKNTLVSPLNFTVTSLQGTQINCTAIGIDPPTIRCNYNGDKLWRFNLNWKSIANPACNITLQVGNSIVGGPGRILSYFNDYNFIFSPNAWNAGNVNISMTINRSKAIGCR